ncbi:MAG: hypothetical protein JXA14_23725 [Anaerolineae bacterium]|nr:hypothetical protein [Anaerolineae bacterium]
MMLRGRNKLSVSVAAIRRGDRVRARELLYAILEDEPRNLTAWSWACEIATTHEERVYCLKRILEIDPSHKVARRYLAQLQVDTPTSVVPVGKTREGIAGLLFAPASWLLQVSPTTLGVVALMLAILCGVIYFRTNTDFFGLVGLDFDALTISDSYERVSTDGMYWTIDFEGGETLEFAGVVRHVSPIREDGLRILTHDVLITSGDYADPEVVGVSVLNHRFNWWLSSTERPSGQINLLHTVPASEKVYRQLLEIRVWDEVVVTGREIRVIKAYYEDGEYVGDWHDSGCNTLLVESVSIVEE